VVKKEEKCKFIIRKTPCSVTAYHMYVTVTDDFYFILVWEKS